MVVLVTLLAVVVALLALLVAGLLRSHAEIIRALHELGADLDPDSRGRRGQPAAVPAPRREGGRRGVDVSGETPDGDAIGIGVVGAEHATLVAFLTSGCVTCADFWDAFGNLDELAVPGDARLVVVTKSGGNESVSKLRQVAPADIPVVMSTPAWEAYDVPVAPYFVYVDGPSGEVLGEGAASTWERVVSLLSQALEDAGVDVGSRSRRHRRRRPRGDAAREARADRDLLAAGIHPGHPSLYPRSEDDLRQTEGQTEAEDT
ncbi:MAG TPA: hypothetical protein VMQ81_11730 [Acidimicrobiia bacterium]|nr:hypothetical protein [Acidimicrobiia bacterium]